MIYLLILVLYMYFMCEFGADIHSRTKECPICDEDINTNAVIKVRITWSTIYLDRVIDCHGCGEDISGGTVYFSWFITPKRRRMKNFLNRIKNDKR